MFILHPVRDGMHFPVDHLHQWHPGRGGTLLQEANRDVPLDGVALSRLE